MWWRRRDLATEGLADDGTAIERIHFLRTKPKKGKLTLGPKEGWTYDGGGGDGDVGEGGGGEDEGDAGDGDGDDAADEEGDGGEDEEEGDDMAKFMEKLPIARGKRRSVQAGAGKAPPPPEDSAAEAKAAAEPEQKEVLGRGPLQNCILHHRVGSTTDVIALRQLPLHQIDVAAVFADVNDDDVRAHGGSELQIADSEAITSTVLLREMHAQMHEAAVRRGRRGAPPLTIVTQVRRLDTGLPPWSA